jgi:hypothetical protein
MKVLRNLMELVLIPHRSQLALDLFCQASHSGLRQQNVMHVLFSLPERNLAVVLVLRINRDIC